MSELWVAITFLYNKLPSCTIKKKSQIKSKYINFGHSNMQWIFIIPKRSQHWSLNVSIVFITSLKTHAGSFKHSRGQSACPEGLCHVSGVLDFVRERLEHVVLVQSRGGSVDEHPQRLQASHAQVHTATLQTISKHIFI